MKHKIIMSIMIIIIIFSIGCAKKADTKKIILSGFFYVEGTITFKKKGKLFVKLSNKAAFDEKGNEDAFFMTKTISPNPDEYEKKSVAFKFVDVPSDYYLIQIFQDVNGNNKLDTIGFLPKEPTGMYKKGFKPNFRTQKFLLDRNISDLKIVVK